jgi:putative tryptophan/tyrosine transport system substrate-binding protein
MKAKILVYALPALILTIIHLAEAQQAEKVFRIGYLGSSGSGPPQAFRQGLRDLGYVEGKNVVIEFRTRRGKSGWSELADELVGLKVDVIVAGGAGAVTAAKNASATTPIVMEQVNDPIALGLVASLAHPGGNITGISNLSPELSGKRLELLKEVIPKVYRVAVLALPVRGAAMQTSIKETEAAAQSLRMQLQLLEVKGPAEIESAFDAAKSTAPTLWCRFTPCSLNPISNESSISPQNTGCRRCTIIEMMLRLADLCPTGRTART